MITKEELKNNLLELINEYNSYSVTEKERMSEDDTRAKFIDSLLKEVLGWSERDIDRQTSIESLTPEGHMKRADYSYPKIPEFIVEAKKLSVPIDDGEFDKQVTDYAYSKAVNWAILTNFKSFRVWYVTRKKKEWFCRLNLVEDNIDQTVDELFYFTKDSITNGVLDKKAEIRGIKLQEINITADLTESLNESRQKINNYLKRHYDKRYSEIDREELTQGIINRLIFIKKVEAEGLEENKLEQLIRKEKSEVYKKIAEIFSYYREKYDSDIFGSPDEKSEVEKLNIDDSFALELLKVISEPQNSDRAYNFAAMDVDVLGSIYENYLAYIQKGIKLIGGKAKRKEHGIYYTPKYVVDYVVENTINKVLVSKPKKPVKILDLACGSGSFLISAMNSLDEYYKNKIKNYPDLSLNDKLNLMKNNIYGVDLDERAVQIAKLSIYLELLTLGIKQKSVRSHDSLLPELGNNIKVGNSIVSSAEVAKEKAFIWNDEFKNILNDGGFDIVIGNPPYERTLYLEKEKEYYSKTYESAYGAYDILVLFIEKGLQLLKEGGYLGFIVSNKFLVSDYGKKLRELLLKDYKIIKIVDLADAKRVFPDALVSTAIIIIQKTKTNSNYKVKVFVADKNTITFDEDRFIDIPLDKFVSSDSTFNVRYSGAKDTIYNKLNKMEKFGNVFKVRTGIMGFEYWKMEPFLHDGRKGKADVKIATNSYIEKYKFLWGKEVNLYKRTFIEPYMNIETAPINKQTKELFLTKNKILVRGVARELTAALDEEGTGFLVAVHSIITQGSSYEPELVLGLLNSNLFNWIHKDRFYLGRIPEGSLKYPVSFLKGLPIPKHIPEAMKKKVLQLVELRLSENSKISELGDKRTEEYKRHEDKIAKIENEINEEIYRIYGITADERKIIET